MLKAFPWLAFIIRKLKMINSIIMFPEPTNKNDCKYMHEFPNPNKIIYY